MAAEHVQKWRNSIKRKMVDAFDNKCGLCGYNKCDKVFDFHHLDPSKKDFGIANATMSPIAIEKIALELEKCIMLCANCHREVHAGIIKEILVSNFNKEKFLYKEDKILTHPCAVCGKEIFKRNITCSNKCAGKRAGKVNWANVDLETLLQKYSRRKIAEILGVTDVAVRKRGQKLGLIKRRSETETI